MSAVMRPLPEWRFSPMTAAAVDAVLAVEAQAYEFPWSRGNFIDSLAAGHTAELMSDEQGNVLGYWVAMNGVDEVHLLNLTVAPAVQGRGHALTLLERVRAHCRSACAGSLWLEVRIGNRRARAVYERWGMRAVGLRRGYYPAAGGRREDALVMSLQIGGDDGAQ